MKATEIAFSCHAATVTNGPLDPTVCHGAMIPAPDGQPFIIHQRKPGHA